MGAQDDVTAKPEHRHDEQRTQELAHRVSQSLTHSHAVGGLSELVATLRKAPRHLLLGDKGLDDAQSSQRLVQLSHRIAPLILRIERFPLQLLAYGAHHPTHTGQHQQRKERQLPAGDNQRGEIEEDKDRILEQHI